MVEKSEFEMFMNEKKIVNEQNKTTKQIMYLFYPCKKKTVIMSNNKKIRKNKAL